LVNDGREHEVPRYVILSDFQTLILFDLEENTKVRVPLLDLRDHVHRFAFLAGYESVRIGEAQDPANIKAAEIMADLHDALAEGGYAGGDLDKLLTRILFCLFAEDSGIFDEPEIFSAFIEERTNADGSDLGPRLVQFFQTLNTPTDKRQKHLDEFLASLPYVNGDLFRDSIALPEFNAKMRTALLRCAAFDWAKISPAVFGSIFQGVMDPPERRQIGAHYTSEPDIMKVLRGLFLDELETELQSTLGLKVGKNQRLDALHEKIAAMRFLDPACGCGNFLILAFREVRRIEQEILVARHGKDTAVIDIGLLNRVSVDQFYGIEILPFPVEIARTGMWLMEHQMNRSLSDALGLYFVRLPLTGAAHVVCANALRTSWADLLPPADQVLVLGNPPFVGKKEQNTAQKDDMSVVWAGTNGAGSLDYVTCWYRRAVEYMQGTTIRCAFVSTNSITQGEQVGTLWSWVFANGALIQWAHRTFPWTSEARGKAHVHVVIIGFGLVDTDKKTLWEYNLDGTAPATSSVHHLSPYLIEGNDVVLFRRSAPLCSDAPVMTKGSEVTDAGHLLLSVEEREVLIKACPSIEPRVRPFGGGAEYIQGTTRFCLWLRDAPPGVIRACKPVVSRLASCRQFRERSPKARTRALASTPHLFGEDRQPTVPFLIVPKVSSQLRRYIPIGYLEPNFIVSGSAQVVPAATKYEFGVISSVMHMAWMRLVCGRTKSDYQYSVEIVYNNFPWPRRPDGKRVAAVEAAAQAVLDARAEHPSSTLADLYDPVAMPAALAKAHAKLDRAVEKCYRKDPFKSDRERLEYLFQLYGELISPVEALATAKSGRKRKPVARKRK
jgi:hypothetical protein